MLNRHRELTLPRLTAAPTATSFAYLLTLQFMWRPSLIPSLCTHFTRAGIEWRRCQHAVCMARPYKAPHHSGQAEPWPCRVAGITQAPVASAEEAQLRLLSQLAAELGRRLREGAASDVGKVHGLLRALRYCFEEVDFARDVADAGPSPAPPQYKRVLEYFSRYGIR